MANGPATTQARRPSNTSPSPVPDLRAIECSLACRKNPCKPWGSGKLRIATNPATPRPTGACPGHTDHDRHDRDRRPHSRHRPGQIQVRCLRLPRRPRHRALRVPHHRPPPPAHPVRQAPPRRRRPRGLRPGRLGPRPVRRGRPALPGRQHRFRGLEVQAHQGVIQQRLRRTDLPSVRKEGRMANPSYEVIRGRLPSARPTATTPSDWPSSRRVRTRATVLSSR
jgi:hypothetical protein